MPPVTSDLIDEDVLRILSARGLGETQAKVLALVAAGASSSGIAQALCLAPGTVSSSRADGYRLLGIHSREELVELIENERRAPERRRRRRRLAYAALGAVLVAVIAFVCVAWAGARWQSEHPYVGEDGSLATERIPFTAVDSSGTELFGVNEAGQRFGRHDFVVAYMGGRAELHAAESQDGTGAVGYVREGDDSGTLYDSDGDHVIGSNALPLEQVARPEAGE